MSGFAPQGVVCPIGRHQIFPNAVAEAQKKGFAQRCMLSAKSQERDYTQPVLKSNQIYRNIVGIDSQPVEMVSQEIEMKLKDSFFKLIKGKSFPLSLRAILEIARKDQFSVRFYKIAEGGMVDLSITPPPVRTFRIAVALFPQGSAEPAIFVSTASHVDDVGDVFLQLMSWDPENKVMNFYARDFGTWIWAGTSQHALEKETRGKGPFCGHPNGSPQMKELKAPWSHWHSMQATLDEDILPANDPLRVNSPFQAAELFDASDLEKLIRGGISRWNKVRVQNALARQPKTILQLPHLFRQFLTTTMINLVSSSKESNEGDAATDTELPLPVTFFLNVESFRALALPGPFQNTTTIKALYAKCLEKYHVEQDDGAGFTLAGDTHFAFLVPETAQDDIDLLKEVIRRGILSERLAASLLMVDFPNPVYSEKRGQLMKYVPEFLDLASDETSFAEAFEKVFVKAVKDSEQANIEGSVESEFLQMWETAQQADWKTTFNGTLKQFKTKIDEMAKTEEGLDAIFRLAESRRWSFKQTPLFEFPLTLPKTNIPESTFPLSMDHNGHVKGSA